MRRRSVDLPHPEGPRRATKDPSAISRSMPSIAATPPGKVLQTPSMRTRVPAWRVWEGCCMAFGRGILSGGCIRVGVASPRVLG